MQQELPLVIDRACAGAVEGVSRNATNSGCSGIASIVEICHYWLRKCS